MVKKRILAVAAAITILFTALPEGGVVAEAAKKTTAATAVTGSAIAASGAAIANSGSAIKAKPGKKKPVKKPKKHKVKKAKKKQPKKTVYFTFDDGPGSRVTPKLLKVLKKNNVKATFFIVGTQAVGNKKILKRIAKDGHTLAIHTYTHDYRKIYSSKKAFLADFHKTEKLIKDTTGVQPRYFRFPGGGNNHYMSTKLRNEILKELHKEGYTEMDWNCGTSDAAPTYYNEAALIRYGKTSHWGSDPIVMLQHDANSKYHTPQVTDALISYYRAKGYHFSGLDNYTGPEMCFKRK
ncbi:MAG: polysaccharide deacetylase [Lachnospiraceae bacterium]|nr:polysaccharide deacetylase [Lachnospiraceae bacterium]